MKYQNKKYHRKIHTLEKTSSGEGGNRMGLGRAPEETLTVLVLFTYVL